MQINIKFLGVGAIVLVAFVVEMLGRFTVSLAHEVILTLTSKTKGLGGARIITIPCLCSANRRY